MELYIFINYLMRFIGFVAVVLMIWFFTGAVIKKKLRRVVMTLLMVALCIFGYYMNHRKPNVVVMREDVLYITPKNDIKN
jgi:phosphoglycerol transferase MdoB-like AlkP superfamily enzyme